MTDLKNKEDLKKVVDVEFSDVDVSFQKKETFKLVDFVDNKVCVVEENSHFVKRFPLKLISSHIFVSQIKEDEFVDTKGELVDIAFNDIKKIGGIAALFGYVRPEDRAEYEAQRTIRHAREAIYKNGGTIDQKSSSLFMRPFESLRVFKRSQDFFDTFLKFIKTLWDLFLENWQMVLGAIALSFVGHFFSRAASLFCLFGFGVFYYFRLKNKIKLGLIKPKQFSYTKEEKVSDSKES